MDGLPDDVLLIVLRELRDKDVLACRLVCRRLGSLAVHPCVWRHRSVGGYDSRKIPVLRVAPCLQWAYIDLPSVDSLLYTTTKCAVSELNVSVKEGGAALAALAIRNQQAHGRLKSLSLSGIYKGREDVSALLWTAALVPELKSLSVDTRYGFIFAGPPPLPPHLHISSVPRPSLTYFSCAAHSYLQPFCDFVLSAHAPTLETVDLSYRYSALSNSTAPLLAGMPNLRRLSCPPLPGMEVVAACDLLRDVHLYVEPSSVTSVPAAAKFLCRSRQLRKVYLEYVTEASSTGVGVDLVKALVSAGPSAVEALTIDVENHGLGFPQLQPLLCALPRMPALQKMRLSAAPDELLLTITPTTHPALRKLKLHPGGPKVEDSGCAHSCLHRESMQTLLSRNPQLDLSVYCSYYCPPSESCEWCEEGCHREVWKKEWEEDGWGCDGDDDPLTDWLSIPRIESISDDLKESISDDSKGSNSDDSIESISDDSI